MKKAIFNPIKNRSSWPSLPSLTKKEISSLNEKVDIDKLYNLPTQTKYCRKCVISNQRPRITINSDGICNACKYWTKKDESIDWESRKHEFTKLCDTYRSNDGSFDVLVPSSGGKDSSLVAFKLKDEYGMHPLTVTWAPAIHTEVGYLNFQNHIHNGLDNILVTANGLIHRRLCRSASILMGDPFQPFIYGQVNSPLRIAQAYDIPWIVDGENGEVEYGGDESTEDKSGFESKDSTDYWQSGIPVEYWQDYGYSESDLNIYQIPKNPVKVRRVFYSYFHNWRPHDHFYYVSERAGFISNPDRSECTYSRYASLDDTIDPFHYYLGLLKFGIGRATSDAAHEIRECVIDREEGIRLVKKFDIQAPSAETTKIFMEYCDLNKDQLLQVVDKWKNERIWKDREDFPELNFF